MNSSYSTTSYEDKGYLNRGDNTFELSLDEVAPSQTVNVAIHPSIHLYWEEQVQAALLVNLDGSCWITPLSSKHQIELLRPSNRQKRHLMMHQVAYLQHNDCIKIAEKLFQLSFHHDELSFISL